MKDKKVPNVGDEIRFVPSAYINGFGSESAKDNLRGPLIGTVVQVNQEHRWYRVAYPTEYSGTQYECIKF